MSDQRELTIGEEITWLDGVTRYPAEVLSDLGEGYYRIKVAYFKSFSGRPMYETKTKFREDLYLPEERARLIDDLRGIAEDALESVKELESEPSAA